jgi:putative FmdB family regulatory protein
MPIYEFYCRVCNTLFNFFSPRVDTESSPPCPRCDGRRLERRPASFATLRHRDEAEAEDPFAGLDDGAMEGLMGSLMSDLEGSGGEEDPRALARVFRRFGEATGVEPGPKMEELLARLEAGADPDELDGDFDDEDESLDQFFRFKRQLAGAAAPPPRPDETH